MLRAFLSRLIGCALVAAALTTLPGAGSPASAATGDVLTMQWHNASSSGTQVATSALVTKYAADSASYAGGARVAFSAFGKSVTLAPPTGTVFEAGKTYSAVSGASAGAARLTFSNTVWGDATCPTRAAGVLDMNVDVQQAVYDTSGQLTSFSADYFVSCSFGAEPDVDTQEDVSGSIRLASAQPYLALLQTVSPDRVPIGKQRTTSVTITGRGTGSMDMGLAAVWGHLNGDYAVAHNGCEGVTLTDGVSCTVDVSFTPLATQGLTAKRVGQVVVIPAQWGQPFKVRLENTAIDLPGQPDDLTTFPTAGGVGLSWHGSFPAAQSYLIERRLDGDDDWVTVTTVDSTTSSYVDPDVPPGAHVTYRVKGLTDGWEGPASSTETTRPADLATASASALVAWGTTDASDPVDHVRDGVDGGTVQAWSEQGSPTISATAAATGDGSASDRVTFHLPVLPGPGTYDLDSHQAGTADFQPSTWNCTAAPDATLVVRSLVYGADLRPLVVDASWVSRCADGTVRHVEIRLGVDGDHALLTADPATATLRTAGSPASQPVTLTNSGPGEVELGDLSVSGAAADDWTVDRDECSGTTLPSGAGCDLSVRLAGTAGGARSALLTVPEHDTAGDLAPVQVPLEGLGVTLPGALSGSADGTVGANLMWWATPDTGHGTVQGYDLQRSDNGGAWKDLATTSKESYADRSVYRTHTYSYRARAVNEVGQGPWTALDDGAVHTDDHAVVVSGEADASGVFGLFQLDDDQRHAPPIPLTDDTSHDYESPAVSPAGTRLAVSRSTEPGVGDDGEYDLWTGTLSSPASTRLTSMSGAETEPAYSPDASQIAFTSYVTGSKPSVWLVAATGGQPHRLRDAASSPTWTPDGSDVIVEDDSSDDAPLQKVDPSTGAAAPIAGTAGATEPTMSRLGDLAYSDTDGRIAGIPWSGGGVSVLATPTSSQVLAVDPAYDAVGRLFYESFTWTQGTSTVVNADEDTLLTDSLSDYASPAPFHTDVQAPALQLESVPDVERGYVSPYVTTSDHDETPDAALHPLCRVDSGAWQPCSRSLAPHFDVTDGSHTLYVKVTDEAGHSTTTSKTFVSDTTAPTVTMHAPTSAAALGSSAKFSWAATDAVSGVASYDVGVRTATPGTAFTPYRAPTGWAGGSLGTSVSVPVLPGQETCLRVRAVDGTGLASTYSVTCVGQPVDDRSLTASTGWKRGSTSSAWNGTQTTVARKNATLTTKVTATVTRVGVLATTCKGCGKVNVYVGSKRVGTVSLSSTATHYRQLLVLHTFTALTGKVSLHTTSRSAVRVDGLLLRRT